MHLELRKINNVKAMTSTDYDSDSSTSDSAIGISTTVLLGYATKEPTDDTISHLGGEPVG